MELKNKIIYTKHAVLPTKYSTYGARHPDYFIDTELVDEVIIDGQDYKHIENAYIAKNIKPTRVNLNADMKQEQTESPDDESKRKGK